MRTTRPGNVDRMWVAARRGSIAIVLGMTLAAVCFAADAVDLVVDSPVLMAAIPRTDEVALLSAPARQPQPNGDDYHTQLYRADLRRPTQWGS